MDHNDIPCRVSAETRQHYSSLNGQAPEAFNPHDEHQMHDTLGNERLARPVADLLISLQQIDITSGSFGVDPERAFKWLVPQLVALREAVKAEWEGIR